MQASPAGDAWQLPYKVYDGTDFEVTMVRLMGRLTSLAIGDTTTEMTISDSTGLVSLVRTAMDDDVDWATTLPTLEVGRLMEFVVQLKLTGEANMLLNPLFVRPLPSGEANRYTEHLLECMFFYAQTTKGPLPPINTTPGGAGGVGMGGHAMGSGAFGASSGGYGAAAGRGANSWGGAGSTSSPSGAALAAADGGRFGDSNVEAVAKAYEALKDVGGEEGTSVHDAHSWLLRNGYRMDEHTLRNAIGHLTMEGQLYSTVDEEHHRVTS